MTAFVLETLFWCGVLGVILGVYVIVAYPRRRSNHVKLRHD